MLNFVKLYLMWKKEKRKPTCAQSKACDGITMVTGQHIVIQTNVIRTRLFHFTVVLRSLHLRSTWATTPKLGRSICYHHQNNVNIR